MKKALILAVVGLLSFAAGTAGIYLAMPQLSPDTHDSTRVRLDRLGLLPTSGAAPPAQTRPAPDSLFAHSSDSTIISDIVAPPTPQDLITSLRDSIRMLNNTVLNLTSDTAAYIANISTLSEEINAASERQMEAAELTQSLAKLEDKQLGNILRGLDLSTIELIYNRSTARERTRLLQSMGADQAARFVRTLVHGPEAVDEAPENVDKAAQDAAAPTSNS